AVLHASVALAAAAQDSCINNQGGRIDIVIPASVTAGTAFFSMEAVYYPLPFYRTFSLDTLMHCDLLNSIQVARLLRPSNDRRLPFNKSDPCVTSLGASINITGPNRLDIIRAGNEFDITWTVNNPYGDTKFTYYAVSFELMDASDPSNMIVLSNSLNSDDPSAQNLGMPFVASTIMSRTTIRAIAIASSSGLLDWMAMATLSGNAISGTALGEIITGVIMVVALALGFVIRRWRGGSSKAKRVAIMNDVLFMISRRLELSRRIPDLHDVAEWAAMAPGGGSEVAARLQVTRIFKKHGVDGSILFGLEEEHLRSNIGLIKLSNLVAFKRAINSLRPGGVVVVQDNSVTVGDLPSYVP
ncbi:hypothetical protein BC830DRAFT_1087196, partial [Chytriomyces sp. MP71]